MLIIGDMVLSSIGDTKYKQKYGAFRGSQNIP